MKALYLLRHAKSSWDEPDARDHDRPLSPRGRRAAGLVAAHLRRRPINPELVLCSSARRAHETLDAIIESLGGRAEVIVEGDLYGAGEQELLARIREVRQGVASVMVIAHNPGLAELTVRLAGDGDDRAMSSVRVKFPTGGLATLSFEGDWRALGAGVGFLESFVVPRELT